jgi:LuxR family maltose regulon positive regulatory protein
MRLLKSGRSNHAKSICSILLCEISVFAHEPSAPLHKTGHHASLLNEPLSLQEQKVLRLLAAGNSNAEIARELVVSVNTVHTQVQSIYRKLNVGNRVEASAVAKEREVG